MNMQCKIPCTECEGYKRGLCGPRYRDIEPELEKCECCNREAELNEDGECASCEADLKYSIEDYMKGIGH